MVDTTDLFDEVEGLVLEDASKLFSSEVIDHFRNPRNYGAIENADGYTFMSGICGDTIGIFVNIEGGRVSQLGFVTNGCGPTIACASAITCMAEGKAVDEALKISGADLITYLGGLPKENTHCADLAANTLNGALEKVKSL